MDTQQHNTEDKQFNQANSQHNGSGHRNAQNDDSGYEDAPESGEGIHNDEDAETDDNGSEGNINQNDNSGYEDAPESGDGINDIDDTDKYLALEQPGVQYTPEKEYNNNSDQLNYGETDNADTWNEEGGNSKNSDAFNQDDYILGDNVDLDEDQNQSISSDDEDFEESNERYTN